jgi:shikimate kinase
MDNFKHNLIYLTGFMGSGKSTIAPILANTLGLAYVDIDPEIENITGKKISEIFSDLGEEYFRDIERSVIQEVSRRNGCVVSLGGGTITDPINFHIIKSTGILIYLRTSTEQILKRLKYKTDRPLMRSNIGTTIDEKQLHERISTLLTKREPYYNKADLIISTDDKKVGETVDEIVKSLNRFVK